MGNITTQQPVVRGVPVVPEALVFLEGLVGQLKADRRCQEVLADLAGRPLRHGVDDCS